MGKLNFQDRKNARIERYKELADANKKASEKAYQESKRTVEHIPMGQPILVGHHSEKSHRATLKKSWDKMDKSIELDKKSKYYEDKAKATERNTAISSDDPDAIIKLKVKLDKLLKNQEKMKAINKICRSKKLTDEEKKNKLKEKFKFNDNSIYELLNPQYSYQKKGFQSWVLSNNNGSIKQVRDRIEKLESIGKIQSETIKIGEVTIEINSEDNRVELYFPDKPSEEFRKLIKQKGFRWSRFKGAWQKQISNWNIKDAKSIAEQYNQ